MVRFKGVRFEGVKLGGVAGEADALDELKTKSKIRAAKDKIIEYDFSLFLIHLPLFSCI